MGWGGVVGLGSQTLPKMLCDRLCDVTCILPHPEVTEEGCTPPPFSPSNIWLTAENLLQCQEDLSLKKFWPAFGRDHRGTGRLGVPANPPPPLLTVQPCQYITGGGVHGSTLGALLHSFPLCRGMCGRGSEDWSVATNCTSPGFEAWERTAPLP